MRLPLVPPLYYENCFIADFNEKVELSNCFFPNNFFLLVKHSELPIGLSFRTDKRLSSVIFSAEDIGKILFRFLITIKPIDMIISAFAC